MGRQPITFLRRVSRAEAPVGCQPCSTAFKSRACRLAFDGVVDLALTPFGVDTLTRP
jgi:hypothetical protein